MHEPEIHELPDPNVCPSCGALHSLRELAKRVTWQPVVFKYVPESALPTAIDYSLFETDDETEVTGIDCSSCGAEWASLADLALEQRRIQALRDHADHWRTRAERVESLIDAGRVRHDSYEDLGYAEGAADAYERAIRILQGNGEA